MVQKNEEEGKEKGEVLDTSLLISGMREDFKIALDIAWKLREAGKTIGSIDILNASICINRDLAFVARDRDYENVVLIEPKFRLKLVK